VDAIYNVSGDGMQTALQELTKGNGFDTVIECAGVEGAFDTATELVRPGGTIYSYALHVQPEKINPQPWHWKGCRILNNNWMFPFIFFLSVSFDQTFLFKRKVWLRFPLNA